MTYGTDKRPESCQSQFVFSSVPCRSWAYEGQRVAQEHESGSMVGELVGEGGDIGVDFAVNGSDLERLLVNLVWRA
jgi:hypothetical protein